MNKEEILEMINAKIRDHEIRVAIGSGIVGLFLTGGLVHAIHLNHVLLLS